MDDVNTEKEVMDYCIKLKSIETKFDDTAPISILFFPKIGTDDACLVCYGPHCIQDGMSAIQNFYQISDNYKKGEYPFLEKKSPTFW